MPESVSVPGEVRCGDLKLSQRDYLMDAVKKWSDGPVTLTVKRQRPGKTVAQLGFYFGVLLPLIVEDTGNTTDAVHWYLKSRFLSDARDWVDKATGEVGRQVFVPSLADLNVREMTVYLDKCVLFAAEELNLIVPSPADSKG